MEAGDDELPRFSLFNTASWLEPVLVGPGSSLAVMMPVSRNSISRESLRDGDVVVELEYVLMTTDDGYAGRYEVTGFAVHNARGAMLSPEAIRSMPLGEIFSRALVRSEAGDNPARDLLQLAADRVVRHGGLQRELTLAIGLDSVQPTDDERVSLVYTLAKLVGQDTNRAVAEHLAITPAAAAQRIRRLRRLNHLPPASGQGARRA